MVIGLQIGKLHREGGGRNPPPRAVLDSKKSGLFRVKVVYSCWIFSTKWSDTFRIFFVYGKKQESSKNIYHNTYKKFTFLRRFDCKNMVFGISRNLIEMLVFK